MRKIVLLLVLLGLTGITFGYPGQQNVNECIIQQADSPVIDGVLDSEWDPAAIYERDVNIPPTPGGGGGSIPDDIDPNTVKFRGMWNGAANRLYLLCYGVDGAHYFEPVFPNIANAWRYADCLNIYCDANNSDQADYDNTVPSVSNNVYAQSYTIGYDGSGGSWMGFWGWRAGDGVMDDWAVTVDGDTITYEASITPYSKLILDATEGGSPMIGTVIKTLGVGDIVGFDVDWVSRWNPWQTHFSDRDDLSMSPDMRHWKNAILMLDQKLGPGDTSRAYDPGPANRATGVSKTLPELTWKAGTEVNGEERVYFGTSSGSLSLIAIVSGGSVIPHSAQSTTNVTSFHPFGLGESYFWRVDDINGPCTITGYEWRFTITGNASNPSPSDLAINLPRDVTLSWTAGQFAEAHNIYFGTDETLVTNSDSSVFIVQQVVADVNIDRTNLNLGTTYYWKIVELSDSNTTVVDGPVWEFTVAPYIIIEDYETYTGTSNLQGSWVPGGRAFNVMLSTSVYYSVAQSMSLLYQNDGGSFNAYAVHDLGGAEDWTVEGVTALSIMFKGGASNPPDDIYVELESNGGAQSGRQQYGDTTATQDTGWNEWFIDLSAFGIDLSNVTKITIGVGQDPGVDAGTNVIGGVNFDFVTLAQPRLLCTNQPTADIDGDCDVDGMDLKAMINVWLDFDETRSDPFDGELKLFEDHNAVANSQWANPGLIFNDDSNVANWNDWVDIDDYLLDNFSDKTIVCWVTQNAASDANDRDRYVFGTDREYAVYIVLDGEINEICGSVGPIVIDKDDLRFGYTPLTLGVEYFLALTITSDPNNSTFYVDGIAKGSSNVPDPSKMTRHTESRLFGACLGGYSDGTKPENNAGPFTIRDFRIYDSALSAAQISDLDADPDAVTTTLLRYQMNETTGLVANDTCILFRTAYQPLINEAAELNGETENNRRINLLDYTVLAGQWGDNGMNMWP